LKGIIDGSEGMPEQVRAFYSSAENLIQGSYHANLDKFRRVFPRDQIHVCYFDDIVENPFQTMKGVLSFLGADQGQLSDKDGRLFNRVNSSSRGSAVPDIHARYLARVFIESLKDLADDNKGWPSHWYGRAERLLNAAELS